MEVIAIGNGTAGRETESFMRKLKLPGKIPIIIVNESGASVYSASEAAREEFPEKEKILHSIQTDKPKIVGFSLIFQGLITDLAELNRYLRIMGV